MNRTQILSAVLGLLLLSAGGLYFKGYWKTWEDYRPQITEAVGPCYAEVVVKVGTELGCQPWDNPEQQFKKCIAEADGVTKMVTLMSLMLCQSEQPYEGDTHENSDDI